jgi:hypothetical protein
MTRRGKTRMLKAVFTLLLVIGVCGPAAAQTTEMPWANKMFTGDLVHDFGVVPRGVQLKYTFKMTNIWKVPLQITDIRVGCNCTTAKESTKLLQPGESGSLYVNMDTTRFSGDKTVAIHLTVGPEWVSTATLTVHFNARADVVFNPGEIDFGVIHHGQSPTKYIDVEYAGSFNWAVDTVYKNPDAPFELKAEALRNRALKGYRILATIKPNAAAGTFNQEVIVKTNDPASPTLTFHVLGNIQATLNVAPSTLNLAGVKVGESETRKVIVRGSRPFRILGIEGQGEGIAAPVPDREGTTQIVEITFSPAKLGELKKQLLIRTDLDNETVTITVQGTGT